MYKTNNILLKIILIISIFSLQGCSSQNKEKTPSRRSPGGNPNAIQVMNAKNNEALNESMSVKRSDNNYDIYQDYQSINAPISLNEMKRIKRRPKLNIKELNDLMDNKSNNHKARQETPNKTIEEAPCTEAHCDLQKVIKYNKQKAKTKIIVNSNSAKEIVTSSATKPVVAMPVQSAISSKPSELPKPVAMPVQPAVSSKPLELPKSIVMPVQPVVSSKPSELPKPIAMPVQPAVSSKPSELSPKPAIVPVSLPEIKPVASLPKIKAVANQPEVVEPVQQPIIGNTSSEMLAKRKKVLSEAIKEDISEETLYPNLTPVDIPKVVMPKLTPPVAAPAPAPTAIARFTESKTDMDLSSLNEVLIRCYFTVKNNIKGLFSKD